MVVLHLRTPSGDTFIDTPQVPPTRPVRGDQLRDQHRRTALLDALSLYPLGLPDGAFAEATSDGSEDLLVHAPYGTHRAPR